MCALGFLSAIIVGLLDKYGVKQLGQDISLRQDSKKLVNSTSFISKSELMFTVAVVRPSVCLSSVTVVHPTQAVEIFRNIAAALGTLAVH